MTLIFGMGVDLSVCYVCVCVSVSIMPKGLSGKRSLREGNTGGKSTLRHFHYRMNECANYAGIRIMTFNCSRIGSTHQKFINSFQMLCQELTLIIPNI